MPDSLRSDITVVNETCKEPGSLKAEVMGGVPGYKYLWKGYIAIGPGPEVSPAQSGTYTLSVTDSNGCVREWVAYVQKIPCNTIFVAGGMSPNGDGINDKWLIDGLQDYPMNTVQVFDKWGNLVYEHTMYDDSWDGKRSNGANIPDGTYYYLVKLNEPSKTGGDNVFKGTLTIKR
jgi:gliding motility-associated-like protein